MKMNEIRLLRASGNVVRFWLGRRDSTTTANLLVPSQRKAL
jgi:hypothetical protein